MSDDTTRPTTIELLACDWPGMLFSLLLKNPEVEDPEDEAKCARLTDSTVALARVAHLGWSPEADNLAKAIFNAFRVTMRAHGLTAEDAHGEAVDMTNELFAWVRSGQAPPAPMCPGCEAETADAAAAGVEDLERLANGHDHG